MGFINQLITGGAPSCMIFPKWIPPRGHPGHAIAIATHRTGHAGAGDDAGRQPAAVEEQVPPAGVERIFFVRRNGKNHGKPYRMGPPSDVCWFINQYNLH